MLCVLLACMAFNNASFNNAGWYMRVIFPHRMPWNREVLSGELEGLVTDFEGIAKVGYTTGMSIVSLICNVSRTSEILERVRRWL